jgi:hypothetical protein
MATVIAATGTAAAVQLVIELAPVILAGIKSGIDLYEKCLAGDASALENAKDWLGVSGEFSAAVAEWEAAKKRADARLADAKPVTPAAP